MKKILLAADGSSYAKEAATLLSRLPHNEKLEITVLTIVQAPFVNRSYPTANWIHEALEQEKTAAVETFQKIEHLFEGANASVVHLLKEGHLGESIVNVAKEQESDLVVVGARGRSQVSRILLGSTSDYVATHAPCSVLVVRPSESGSDNPLRITFGYEESGPAQAAIEEFSEIVWGPQTEVHVITVSPYLRGFFGEFESDSDSLNHLKAELNKAVDQIHAAAPNAKGHLVESEHIGDGVVQFADDHQSDLIVMGETPRSLLGRVLLGSVSRFVLRHASCSVWITRNRMIEGKKKGNKGQAYATQ